MFGEIAVRVTRPQKTYSEFLELVSDMWAPSDFNKVELKKNYTGKYPSNEFPGKYVTVKTNNLGLRDDQEVTYDKPKDKKRILIIGDSYTFGLFVESGDAYPSILKQLLKEDGSKYEVINAGFPGYNADEEYVWLRNEGIKFKPDIIILGFYIGNDLNINRNNWILDSSGLPLKLDTGKKLGTYVDQYGRRRENDDFVMATETVGYEYVYKIPVLRESQFFIALGKLTEKVYKYFYGKINPSKTYKIPPGYSVAMFPQIFGDDVYRFRQKYNAYYEIMDQHVPPLGEREKYFRDLVLGMNKIAKDINSEFIVLMIPTNFQVDPDYFLPFYFKELDENKEILNGTFGIRRDFFRELSEYLESNNIRYINLLNEMKKHPEDRYFPKNGEMHFNIKGHEFTANIIYNYLHDNNNL
ncbi:MAG: SGNH/GDSL hydrolase family protein [Nitrospirae bacterium]|nr:SGNH/GDSL hydrolase family protein [Nitrospirota bacterium]